MSKKKQIETLADVVPQQVNANRHTQRGMGMLERSVQKRGWIGAITAAADGEIFDGSARREVLEAVGMEDAIIIRSDGTKPIVHIREDIPSADDPKAIELAIEANRIAQVNLDYDPQVLAAVAERLDLSDLFFPHELAAVLEQAGTEIIDAADLWKGMPEFSQPGVQSYKDLIVHFKTQEDYEAFSRLINQTLTPSTKAIWYPERPEELRDQHAREFIVIDES